MKNLVVCEGFKYPLDEGGRKATYIFIKSLEGEKLVITSGGKLKIESAVTINVPYYNVPILGYLISKLLLTICVMKIRADNLYYFPLCFPGIIDQIYALFLSRISRNFKMILYQVWEVNRRFKLLSKFNIITTSRSVAENLVREGLTVEYMPIPYLKPEKIYEKGELRKKYGLNEDEFVILHIGHAEKGRGLSVLSELQKVMPDAKIVIVLSSRKKIEGNNLDSKIKVIDWYIEDIYEIYATADVYVFPIKSRKAAIDTPLSIIEAKEMNLPIVISDIGVIKEAVENYPRKYLIKVREEKEMAKEIKQICEGIRNCLA